MRSLSLRASKRRLAGKVAGKVAGSEQNAFRQRDDLKSPAPLQRPAGEILRLN